MKVDKPPHGILIQTSRKHYYICSATASGLTRPDFNNAQKPLDRMLKFLAILFCLKIVSTQFKFAYKGYTIATIGNFFQQQDHQHVNGSLDENEPALTPEFFQCGGKDSCSNVVKGKLTTQTFSEENSNEADLWEKIPTFKSKNSIFERLCRFF